MITYKFRSYPSKKQQEQLWIHANKLNSTYNYFLDQRIKAYEEHKISISRYDQQKQLVELKKQDPVLKEIHSQVLQQVPLRLDLTYKAFFKHCKDGQGFPHFRSCFNFFGIRYTQKGYTIHKDVFHTKVYGDINFHQHRPLKGNIKQVCIITEDNKWYICVTTDYTSLLKKSKKEIVGIDVGITNLVATSDGIIIKNKKHAKYFDSQIKKLQSKRSKCKKSSRKYKYYSQIIRRLYGVKNRKINDFQHKVSYTLPQNYDTIVVENLALKKMSETEKTGLNRELRNSKIANFLQYLSYKSRKLVEVNPRNTSKTCNKCGKVHKMPLHIRTMSCKCGNVVDRDVNAAINILCLGQAILTGLCNVKDTIQEAMLVMYGIEPCTGSSYL